MYNPDDEFADAKKIGLECHLPVTLLGYVSDFQLINFLNNKNKRASTGLNIKYRALDFHDTRWNRNTKAIRVGITFTLFHSVSKHTDSEIHLSDVDCKVVFAYGGMSFQCFPNIFTEQLWYYTDKMHYFFGLKNSRRGERYCVSIHLLDDHIFGTDDDLIVIM